jgi:hypothetical protein
MVGEFGFVYLYDETPPQYFAFLGLDSEGVLLFCICFLKLEGRTK